MTFSSFDYRHAIDMCALSLLSPSVRELTIRFNRAGFGDASRFRIAFSSSLSATPHPERLSVMVVPWSSVDLESLSRSYSHLRYLQVDSKIDPHYLTFVAFLPDLEHLSIRLSFHSSEASEVSLFPTMSWTTFAPWSTMCILLDYATFLLSTLGTGTQAISTLIFLKASGWEYVSGQKVGRARSSTAVLLTIQLD